MTTTMNRADFAQAIDTTCVKLLRMVSCWLMLAHFMRRTRLSLPPRICRWVLSHILKAEISIGMLVMTSAHINKPNWLKAWGVDCPYLALAKRYHIDGLVDYEFEIADLNAIVQRLKTLLAALRKLAKRSAGETQSRKFTALLPALNLHKLSLNFCRVDASQTGQKYAPP